MKRKCYAINPLDPLVVDLKNRPPKLLRGYLTVVQENDADFFLNERDWSTSINVLIPSDREASPILALLHFSEFPFKTDGMEFEIYVPELIGRFSISKELAESVPEVLVGMTEA